jgi:hypothetical protein
MLMRIRKTSNSPWYASLIEANALDQRGSAILLALFLTLILSLLGLCFALTAMTDTAIHTSNRETLGTYYVAEAGNEEAIGQIVSTPRSRFNPDKLKTYAGALPVDVTKCFYNVSSGSIPACPVTAGGSGTTLPVSVGAGKYDVRLSYLGAVGTGVGEAPIYKFFVSSSATSNTAALNTSQSVQSQFNAQVIENAFPQHPLTSCLEPVAGGVNNPYGIMSLNGKGGGGGGNKDCSKTAGPVDPTAPPQWPGTGDTNCGVYPMCSFPTEQRLQEYIQSSADFSYSGDVTDSAPLPPTFWKVPPDPPSDPTTGTAYTVYINGNFTVSGNVTIYGVYYITGNVTFSGTGQVQGVIYAPNGTMFTGNGNGNPNVPDAVGGVFVHAVTASGNHYQAEFNPDYVGAFLGMIPQRMSRAGR